MITSTYMKLNVSPDREIDHRTTTLKSCTWKDKKRPERKQNKPGEDPEFEPSGNEIANHVFYQFPLPKTPWKSRKIGLCGVQGVGEFWGGGAL